jgi:hypothetical protein
VLHVASSRGSTKASGGISFRGFIDELRQAADATGPRRRRFVEEGSEGVRLMTVHKARDWSFLSSCWPT